VFAGDGPTRPEVERSARELDLTERVSFLGNRDDIPTLLADADVFVLATKWEGLPLSILEAMRAGLPVIATNVGGVAEAITDGVTGFVTEPGNVDQMRNRIQTLIRSKELLISMGSQARRRYEQDFKLEVMMRKTLRVYQKVLAYGGESLLTEPADSLEI
jgi:glycosyltransferase involved in cell wall biosynthesis